MIEPRWYEGKGACSIISTVFNPWRLKRRIIGHISISDVPVDQRSRVSINSSAAYVGFYPVV